MDPIRVDRRVALGLLAGGAALLARSAQGAEAPSELDELDVAALRQRLDDGRETARSLVEKYSARIEAIDRSGPTLRSILELNPDVQRIADARDAERKKKPGPLHGIPVLLKDNIASADHMSSSAGSLALAGFPAPRDAAIVRRLREAGAVILGKTNLSEWANIRSTRSCSGWSGRGGQTRNPYALDRSPSGSSSGTAAAVAANLTALGVGTETDGSIVSPASVCGLVGLKPTVGLVSRAGIIPISHSQDTAGPITRTVRDAAVLLGVLAGPDSDDPATVAASGHVEADYTRFLDLDGLRGARLGVPRKVLFGYHPEVDRVAEEALAMLKVRGAILVDPAEIDTLGQTDEAELLVLLTELKADLDRYLGALGPGAPVRSLADVIAFNEAHAAQEMPLFGQELFLQAATKGPLSDPDYLAALAKNLRLARTDGIDATMDRYKLDALVAPTGGPAWLIDPVIGDYGGNGCSSLPAIAGYPHITVPAGFTHGLPVGLSFFGRAWSEPVLLRLAYAFEQATKHRQAPRFLGSASV